jgi:hypothetical protein
VDLYELMTWSDLLATLDSSGPASLVRSVREAEVTDQTTERWPRSKPSDDATVAYATPEAAGSRTGISERSICAGLGWVVETMGILEFIATI